MTKENLENSVRVIMENYVSGKEYRKIIEPKILKYLSSPGKNIDTFELEENSKKIKVSQKKYEKGNSTIILEKEECLETKEVRLTFEINSKNSKRLEELSNEILALNPNFQLEGDNHEKKPSPWFG